MQGVMSEIVFFLQVQNNPWMWVEKTAAGGLTRVKIQPRKRYDFRRQNVFLNINNILIV